MLAANLHSPTAAAALEPKHAGNPPRWRQTDRFPSRLAATPRFGQRLRFGGFTG
jgi:hypothetical protein